MSKKIIKDALTTIRLPQKFKKSLKAEARRLKISLSALIRQRLDGTVG